VYLIWGISFVVVVTSGVIKLECIFKTFFGFRCPGCGLTRAFKSIYNFNFIEAINYNILSIPIFIIGIVICFGLIIDIIRNKNTTITNIFKYSKKYYFVVIILLIVAMIINNINSI